MNKHPHVYKTAVGSGILQPVCLAILLCFFAISATAGWKEPSYSSFKLPPATITGKVTDAKNAPMEGVNVSVKGSKRGTITNAAGVYTLANVPENATLLFTYTGYGDKEVLVKGTAPVNVSLVEVVTGLNDVVVIGYGTTTKKDATGAIAQIKATQLENENPRSVQDLLRGNAPGLDIGFQAGTKGSPGTDPANPNNPNNNGMQIRGKGSLKATNEPLIVLNGSIFQGQLADINPNDIATVDVLKDASASAIYGAQASNGVIAITTKKGRIGKPIITFNDNIGLNKVTSVPHLLNADEFISWRQDALWSMASFDSTSKPGIQYKFYNPNQLPSSITLTQWLALGGNTQQSNAADPVGSWLYRLNLNDIEVANYKAGKSINFNDVYYNQNALSHDHTVSISQRKEDFNYYLSMGYMQNQGVTNGEKPYQVYRININLEGNVSKFLTLGAFINFSDRNESGITMNRDYVSRSSPYGNLYNADGTPTFSVNSDPAVSNNPIYDQSVTDRSYKYDNIFANFTARGKLPYGFSYDISFRPQLSFNQLYNHVGTTPTQGGNPTATRTNGSVYNWLLDNTIRWNRTFGKHNVGLQFTQTAEKNRSWSTTAGATGFSPNDLLSYHNIGSATVGQTVSSNDQVTTGAALTGRATYDFNKRYYLTATFRRDGYSGFGTNYPYANFYSVAGQWAFSEERFMQSTSRWLDYAKLRVSYGENGNRTIPDPLATLYTLGSGTYTYLANGSPYNQAIVFANQLANPNLQWEKKAGVNAGVDFSIFKNRVSGSIDYYLSRTSNLIVQRSLPPVSGFPNIWTNLGGVQNSGIEVSINTINMKKKDFEWNSTISFWINRNKIVSLYGASPVYDAAGKQIGMSEKNDTSNVWFIGQPIGVVYDYQVIGVWQTSEAAQAKLFNQSPGDFKILDANGDGKITAGGDKVFQGQTDPLFSFNFRNEFRIFKNFDFAFALYGRLGQKTNADYRYNNDGFANRYNFFSRPYWTPANPINDYARISSYNAGVGSQNFLSSSFVRLSNVSLAYSVPADVVKRWGLQGLKVYANVVNAAVFTSWNWYDPENKNVTPRTYNLGLNVTL